MHVFLCLLKSFFVYSTYPDTNVHGISKWWAIAGIVDFLNIFHHKFSKKHFQTPSNNDSVLAANLTLTIYFIVQDCRVIGIIFSLLPCYWYCVIAFWIKIIYQLWESLYGRLAKEACWNLIVFLLNVSSTSLISYWYFRLVIFEQCYLFEESHSKLLF